MKKKIILLTISVLLTTGCGSKDLIETIKSPNGEYEIRTYLHNCGATCDFGVSADLCNKNDKCKEIYYCYHESESFVYWINNENVFINQKTLNIFKDKYDSMDYDNAFRLSRNIGYYKEMYLISRDNNEYKLDELEADYIDEMATSVFTFNNSNSFNDYDFIFKIVDLEKKSTNEYLLKIDNNKMYLINSDKMSELNRTDYEYMKKILTSNGLYNFS